MERKRQPPEPPKLGAEAASFANTLGGWLLVGVDDDRNVRGWDPGGRVDIQSHIGNLLGNEVDPLPPYLAERVELDGTGFVAVRIFEASDVPVIVRGTGAIYVRDSRGKQPVDDHRTVLALARRGVDAREKAERRLGELPLIARALGPPDAPRNLHAPAFKIRIRTVVRAAPYTVTPQFADWPISRRGAHACDEAAEHLSAAVYGSPPVPPSITPRGRGAVARVQALNQAPDLHQWGAIVAADSGGVIGACLTGTYREPGLPLDELRRSHLRPTIDAAVSMLRQGEAFGQAAIDLWVIVPPQIQLGNSLLPQGARFHCGDEIVVPADEDELHALARRWEREIARELGIAEWQD